MENFIGRVRRHLIDPQSHHRKIATGFVWVSLFVFIGKLAGAAKEMAIAYRYGVSETVDAYVFVFNLVNWPVSVWFSVLSVVLVPLVVRVRTDNPGELPRFRGELLGLSLVVGVGLLILAWLGLPILLRADWIGLSAKTQAEAYQMAGGLALMAPMGVVISLFSVWMLACGRHRNTLFEAIPALTLLVVLLLAPSWFPEPLVWGTIAGLALQMAALATPLKQRAELQCPKFALKSTAWQGFWGSVGIMAVGQVLMSFTTIIDQFFAAGLGSGALSTLSYANRILALVLGMGAMAIGRATLPVFSEANVNSGADVNCLALRWAKWMFGIGVGVVTAGWFFAPWIVGLLFERGAFTTSDTAYVSLIFQYALIQVPLYLFALTLVSLFASQRRYGILLLSGMIGIFAKIFSAALLVPLMQLKGLVLSVSLVYLANSSFFYYLMYRERK